MFLTSGVFASPYQRLAYGARRILYYAPMVLIIAGVTVQLALDLWLVPYLRYIWLPWVLSALLLLTAFHPFSGSIDEDEDYTPRTRWLLWVGAWLYPLGFSGVIFVWMRLGIEIMLLFLAIGWIGWGLLGSYMRYAYTSAAYVLTMDGSYDDEAWDEVDDEAEDWDGSDGVLPPKDQG